MEHHSWKQIYVNYENDIKFLEQIDYNIPKYDINDTCYQEMYDNFFNKFGCIIIKNAYSNETMNSYDKWCDNMYEVIKSDVNINHSIQSDKILYNNIVERMGNNNSELLYNLLGHQKLNNVLDNLLGFSRIGSCTGHKVLKNGNRQETHVDYPIHLNASPFWKNDGGVSKLKRMITRYQLNYVLPYFSLQSLTAICDMDKSNGSTEIVPCTHLIEDIDIKLRDENFRNIIENYFMNVTLQKGDVLIFNRRLCHRGGKNYSDHDRNALITQYVWGWGIGQEEINYKPFFDNLNDIEEYKLLTDKEKEMFKMRFNFKYPRDVSVQG